MQIRDPKHVQKHRVVMIGTFVGILIVFGVWAVQIQQMFAQQAVEEVAEVFEDEDIEAAANYVDQLEAFIPGLNDDFLDELIEQGEEAVARSQAQEESEGRIAEELMKRFEAQAEAEAAAALEAEQVEEATQ